MTPPSPTDSGAPPRSSRFDSSGLPLDPMASRGRRRSRLPDDPSKSFGGGDGGTATESAGPRASLSRWALARVEHDTKSTTPRGMPESFPAEPGLPAYILERVVGRGGYGEVWQAVQTSLARSVAVKRLREDLYEATAVDSQVNVRDLEASFRQEALTTGRLEHPNIVPVHDFGLDAEGRPLLAMKLVKGKPWNRLLEEDKDAPLAERLGRHLPILVDVAQAVAFAHSRGIVHRDIKPSQVMAGEFGEVLLMDWGLAIIFDEERARHEAPELAVSSAAPTLARATSPSGTPAFMAPEQTDEEASRIGPWTDVYLLGGTLYFVLTGTPPHDAREALAAFRQAMDEEVPPPEERAPNAGIPPELSALCMACLRRDPAERPASAFEFIQAVRDYQSGASRQRESDALTREVAASLESAPRTYEDLADCEHQLVRALGLWPGNPRAAPLRDRVLTDYARLAIANDDLVLARVQASRLSGGDAARALLAEIERQESAAAGRARQRRQLWVAVGVLGGLVVLGALVSLAVYQRGQVDRQLKELTANQNDLILRSTQSINEANELLKAEAQLAERIAGVIPMPTSVLAREDEARWVETERARQALEELGEVMERRAALRETIQESNLLNRIGEAPVELLLVEPNIMLRTATTAEQMLAARALYERVNSLYPEHPLPLRGMGLAAARAGLVKEAVEALSRSTNRARLRGGDDNAEYLRALQLEAEAVRDLAGGRPDFLAEFDAARTVLEPRWAELTLALSEQARSSGDVALANDFAQLARRSLEARFGRANPRTADALEAEASSLAALGCLDQALGLFREVLVLRQATLTPANPVVLRARHRLALVLDDLGRHAEAEGHHRAAAELELNGSRRALLLDGLARNLHEQARYGEALAAFDEALALRREALGPDHPFTAQTLATRAVLVAELGDLATAVPDSIRATFAIANVTGLQHPDSAEAERQRAEILLLQGETVNALERVEVAIAGLEGAPGEPPPVAHVKLRILRARLLLERERPREALAEARSAVELARDRIGPGTPLHAAALAALASAAAAMNEPTDSESALREALSIQARQLGPRHPTVLATAAEAGDLPEASGRAEILAWARSQANMIDISLARPHVEALRALEAAEAGALDRRASRLRAQSLAEFLVGSSGTATADLIDAAALRARLAPLGEPPDWAALVPGLRPLDPEASP